MMSRTGIAATFIIFVFMLAGPVLGQPDPADYDAVLSYAEKKAAGGDLDTAAALMERSIRLLPIGDVKAERVLALAILLDDHAPRHPEKKKWLKRTEQEFERAITMSTGETRFVALNGLAVHLLKRTRPRDARSLIELYWDEFRQAGLDSEAQARIMYNYGQALELTGEHLRAIKIFREAYDLDPEFGSAAREAARLALTSPSESVGIPELMTLTDRLLEQGDYLAAGEYLLGALDVHHWIGHQEYPRLLYQMMRYFTRSGTSIEEYKKTWKTPIEKIIDNGPPNIRKQMKQIDEAFVGSMRITVVPDEARYRYKEWGDQEEMSQLSRFLKMIGDRYYREDDTEKALQRYSIAWSLDTTNMEAGIYLANIFSMRPNDGLLEEFIAQVFTAKGNAYLGDDWQNIFKFHCILGSLFEKLDRSPLFESQTAVFQWEHALKAHEMLLYRKDPVTPRYVPHIHASLARAYGEDGRKSEAWDQFMIASEQYIEMERFPETQKVLDDADSLGYSASDSQMVRMAAVRKELNSVSPGSIQGTVLSEDGKPVPGVLIKVRGPAGGIMETQSDANGIWVMKDLLPGIYNVEAAVTGDSRVMVQDVDVDSDKQTPIDLYSR